MEKGKDKFMEFHLENPLNSFQELPLEIVASLFLGESDHMPCEDYVMTLKKINSKNFFRRETVSLIMRASQSFNPFIQYLSINYLDRFLSIQGVPQPKPWIMRVFAVSCVSLAAKMTNTDFLLTDIQVDEIILVDAQTLHKMEVTILGVLKWRMRSITPFSFVHFFVSQLKLKDRPLMEALKAQAFHFITNAQNDIKLLEFKPSIIAASAVLCASHEVHIFELSSLAKSLSSCSFVNVASMQQCFSRMKDASTEHQKSITGSVSSSDEGTSVLQQYLFTSDSETGEEGSLGRGRDVKRRKLGGLLWQSDDTAAAFSDPPAAT